MKNFLLALICLIALNKAFCQSFTYDAFLMGEQNSHLTSYPVPITIKSFGIGRYIIEANGFNGQIKINDTIKFDQFNQWEELYRYKGISRTVFDKGNDGKIELTTYMTFTTKYKMSDFANGLNINSNTISDDFEINIENKTLHTISAIPSYRDEKYSYITIVPYLNGNLEQKRKEVKQRSSVENYENSDLKKLSSVGAKGERFYEEVENESSETEYLPKTISESYFKINEFETGVIGNDSINSEYVLSKLFKGQLYSIYDENVIAWACKDCKECKFDTIYGYMEFPESFPYSRNYTIVSGFNKYSVDGEKFLLMTFSTSFDYPPTVYTTPGILGIAQFKKNLTKWELVYFNPFAAALGTYQYAGRFDNVVPINMDTVLCFMTFTDGGHGLDLVEKSLYVFSFQDENFTPILNNENYEYNLIPDNYKENEPIIQWKAHFEATNNEINITKEGSVKQETISDLNSADIYGLPIKNNELYKIFEAAKRLKEFDFNIIKKYKLINGVFTETVFDASIIENKVTRSQRNEIIEGVIYKWNKAHNFNDKELFTSIFADTVLFYQTALIKEKCLNKKELLLKKYPDFEQEINGKISFEELNKDEVKCSFVKTVKIGDKTTNYPSYLILIRKNTSWKITVEGDLITDQNLAKLKAKI